MKKYLMTALTAVALSGLFTGCSKEMETNGETTAEADIIQTYENAFITRFGQPHENQTWGFGSVAGTRSGNTSGEYAAYPATHTYTDANGNVIAGANMNHNEWGNPNTNFGGWIVPDPLTAGQKLRVQKYFQANPNLSYEDPHYANFFIQQVYTGGTNAPETGNKEATKAANGQVHAGSTLNQLTVGQACSHINDFNAGTCTTSNVLNHEGKTQSDQITLMVNVDDTSCFGYHETGGSNVKGVINHNDKMALVSAATIDAWAAANGNPGEAVVDKWNRSFMGFDYELLPEEDIIPENPTYAKFTDVPAYNNIHYAWDGTNVMVIGSAPAETDGQGQSNGDLTRKFTGVWQNGESVNYNNDVLTYTSVQWGGMRYWISNEGENWSTFDKLVFEFAEPTPVKTKVCIETTNIGNVEKETEGGATRIELDIKDKNVNAKQVWFQAYDATTFKISKIYLVGEAPVATPIVYYDPNGYLLGDDNKVMFYSSSNTNMYGGTIIDLSEDEMKTTQDGKTCLNLVKFKELADAGYHPISTDLKKWVKWQAACDGYYSDWIVTLTEAKRIGDSGEGGGEGGGADEIESIRVIAEDLNAKESKTFEGGSDFDFNDVVFDVIWNKTQNKVSIKVLADGAEYTMYIGGADEKSVDGLMTVNEMFEASNPDKKPISKRTYPNTAPGSHDDHDNLYYTPYEFDLDSTEWKGETIGQIANSILVRVSKSGVLMTLTAPEAGAAAKVAVGTDYDWCDENQFIDAQDKYNGKFARYVKRELGDDWYKSNVK